jgi:TetR/AcrR family transcriptional repressor of uid operon
LTTYRWPVPVADTGTDMSERIVEAALGCFAEVGIRRTSIDDIALAAGVGRVTVFRRFEGKDRLIQVVLLRIIERMTASVRTAFLSEPDLEAALTKAILVSVAELRDHPVFGKVMRTEPDSFLRTLMADGASVMTIVRRSVTAWLGASGGGPLSDEDAEMVAEWITRLGMSLVLTPGGPIPIDDDQKMRAYVERYLVPGIARLAQ